MLDYKLCSAWKYFLLLSVLIHTGSNIIRLTNHDLMKCSYGERGSLTATCVNATSSYFKNTPYRFDNLDETLKCVNCTLRSLDSGTFDISGNQIKNLDLSYSQIETIKQKAFVGLIFLQELILANNVIGSIYPGTFTGVKKIGFVNLENNSINVLSQDGFLELINLKKLVIRNNHIKTIVPKAFNGLTNLKFLDLSNNQISDITDIFNNLTSLEVLNLNNNKIAHLNGNEMTNLSSLIEITFAYNNIKSIPTIEFVTMNSLRKLDLSNNLIDLITPGSFKGLHLLEDLDLAANNIAEVPQKTLQSLHSLRNLNISFNIISTFQTGLYSGLPQLRSLNLSHNSIEEIEITGVFSLLSLHTLDISNNNITDLDYVAFISRLPRLSYLDMKNNYLPCDLEKDMQEYFSEDNFKFMLFENQAGYVKCVEKSVNTNNADSNHYKMDSLTESGHISNNHGTSTWVIITLCVIFILVSVLYIIQYLTLREIKQINMYSRSTSHTQLVSSELEARDRDYLKE